MLILVLARFPANVGALPHKRQSLVYIDYPGMVLWLVGSVMLTFTLEKGGLAYTWDSLQAVVGFVASGVAVLAFAVWEWFISERRGGSSSSNNKKSANKMLPLLPMRLVSRRVSAFAVL